MTCPRTDKVKSKCRWVAKGMQRRLAWEMRGPRGGGTANQMGTYLVYLAPCDVGKDAERQTPRRLFAVAGNCEFHLMVARGSEIRKVVVTQSGKLQGATVGE